MDTQSESIDISQLKAFALGLGHDHSHQHERDLPPSTAIRRERLQRPATAATVVGNAGLHSAHLINLQSPALREQCPSSAPKRMHGSRTLKAVSQPELPSTIPDSYRRRMLSDDSQSQGDTQRVSQSVYAPYNTRYKQERSGEQEVASTNGIDNEGISQHTVQQGETGHIDLLAAFEQPSIEHDHDEADEVDPLSQDIRAEIFPESRRFQAPRTPASQGRKRKRAIEVHSQEQTTPQLPVNPFAGHLGGSDNIMSATQLFQATQAVTSPLTNLVPSDGLSERPSPDMHNFQRPSTAAPLSSPAKMTRSDTVRAVTEPQTSYISMKESQEARERLLQARKAEQVISPDELSDDDFADNAQLRRRLRQKQFSEDAKNQFAAVAARSENRLKGHDRGHGGQIGPRLTRSSPRKLGRQPSEPVLISDDAPAEDVEGNSTEAETEREDEVEYDVDDEVDELAEDNKENVEVPRTVSRAHQTSQVHSSQPTPSHRPLQRVKAALQSKRDIGVNGVSASQEALENSARTEAIADSQSSQHKTNPSSRRPGNRAFSEPRSSLESRVLVPHSQSSQPSKAVRLPDLSSAVKAVTSSSQPLSNRSPLLMASDRCTRAQTLTNEGEASAFLLPVENRSSLPVSSGSTRIAQSENGEHLEVAISVPVSSENEAVQTSDSPKLLHSTDGRESHLPHSSNAMPSPRSTPKSTGKAASSHFTSDRSHASTNFETALEQPFNSPNKSHPQRLLGKSQSTHSSPRKVKRPRTIGEIAADPSPPDAIGDVDVDINILSNEDIEFQNAIHGEVSAPSRNRRQRRGHGLPLRDTEAEFPRLPRSPLPPPSSAISAITPVQSSSPPRIAVLPKVRTLRRATSMENTEPSRPATANVQEHNRKSNNIEPRHELRSELTKVAKSPSTVTRSSKLSNPASSSNPPTLQPRTEAVHKAPITAPNRVFAHFNGSCPAYHPATCLEVIAGEEPRYSVRFDDGSVDTISAYGIKKLELNAGDTIKIDILGARTKNYVVEGMQDQQRPASPPDRDTPSRRGRKPSTNDTAFPETDIHGFATVLASVKQRASMDANQIESTRIAVPLTLVYFTQTLWTAYKNRQYVHLTNKVQTLTGLQTPSERPSTPSTPSSRSRRIKGSGVMMLSRSTNESMRAPDGIFKSMAFAITNVDRPEDSKRVKEQILSNGGIILDTGFDELFNIPELGRTTDVKENAHGSFRLTSGAQSFGFTCLIADKHCRRAKFVQALALGIPCLATRWISDCVTKQRVLPWVTYLLPSGESTFLGGAVRSRTLQPFLAETSTLPEIVDNRAKLLDGASVLLIMERGQEITMKQHPLLTHALGASKVVRAVSEEAAAKAVADAQSLGEPWDWVFSYDKEKDVEKRLFGGSTTGKKRKRGRNSDLHDRSRSVKTKVVGNEFVIQSLILGMLIEE